ncbi:MAG: hypothetical protein HC887_07475 [Desulfobacteraceae bacterium]|nr:hypothetical protein [Desulfobacteraceae bacterium]
MKHIALPGIFPKLSNLSDRQIRLPGQPETMLRKPKLPEFMRFCINSGMSLKKHRNPSIPESGLPGRSAIPICLRF